jgi:methylated-DNA-[protein]-cysteine S-methyltransferase
MVLERYIQTELGTLHLAVEGDHILQVSKGEGTGENLTEIGADGAVGSGKRLAVQETKACALLDRLEQEIREYFEGRRRRFDLPVHTVGTPFQEKVWAALREIPYGQTRTYGEIAALVGSPKGARAVGMACHHNPVLLLTPCHRVIGSSGKLVGFGCGLEMKEYLLKLERGKL